jgi:hypothetical protein
MMKKIEVELVNRKGLIGMISRKIIIAVTIAILWQHRYAHPSMLGRYRLSSNTSTKNDFTSSPFLCYHRRWTQGPSLWLRVTDERKGANCC